MEDSPTPIHVWAIGEYSRLLEGLYFLEHLMTVCSDCRLTLQTTMETYLRYVVEKEN